MKHHHLFKAVFVLLTLVAAVDLQAQWSSHESVLNSHTWYKIGVTNDGVYGLDYATLQSAGIDPAGLVPSRLRLFGNVAGVLPEANAESRYDDLTEVAIEVTGADDGSFDQGDRILFYGQGPVNMVADPLGYYQYERNPYTDTVYYFLCIDADSDGLRIEDQASVSDVGSASAINIYPDYYCHESEELSPYASGRTWYGDLLTAQEGVEAFQVEVPGMVLTRGVRVESNVLVRCKPRAAYNLTLNDESLVDHCFVEEYKEREYGKEHHINKLVYPNAESLTLRYEFDPNDSNPMLFVDYFVLNFWRELRYQSPDLAFRVLPTQLSSMPVRVEIADMGPNVTCWDVTDPMAPRRQLTDPMEGGRWFGLGGRVERRFRLFEAAGVATVASCQHIPTQNLHGIVDAEMLIITPQLFWSQAESLAAFHQENDDMDCVITDVAQIYNEFSTGAGDPTAIRDFIRMVYLRSGGHLKYVLLLGKGSHDFRDIKGMGNNFVPTYQIANAPYSEVYSMCSDDYFALMDDDEGEGCVGKVDLGVGRIPITTPEQGDVVMEKIRHYADLDATHGLWKSRHLLVADNDSRTYPNYAEDIATILDTAYHVATVKKLYFDSYPVVNTSSGVRIPLANQALMDYLDQGVCVMSYTGHGGVKSLSSEWVLALSDIQSLTNYDKLPLVHTATCEFSKFDDPGVVSGGEQMLLNPQGGAIALLTTMRPTIAQNNQSMSKSFHKYLYERVDQQPLRFGDIYRLAKSDSKYYSIVNMVYVLFGDPALRLSFPSRDVVTEQLTGSELLTVTGFVNSPNGIIDSQFNGVLEVTLYDQKTQYTTMGQYDATTVTYAYHNDVLFEGRASVTNGRFEVQVPVPATVSQGNGMARLSYYAYDTIRKVDAIGVYDNFHVNAPATVVDTQGPDLKLYWNSPDFVSGDVGESEGVLYADLYDEHGIYHYNVSIGRDIVLNSNIAGLDNLILNNRYEPAVDDYRRGRIVLPVEELPDGVYNFALKAWDTWNNASQVDIVLLVERSLLLAEIRNYPNPFTDEVCFSFVDGEMTEELTVDIEVFDVSGRCVARLHEETSSEAGVVPTLRWDGRNSAGGTLRPGLYCYRLTVTTSSGTTRSVAYPMVKK